MRLKSKVEVLSENEIEIIHKKSLGILEKVGIKVPDTECLDLCEKAGANVDHDTEVIKIPAAVMENLLESIRYTRSVHTDCNEPKKLFGGVSTQVFMADYKTRNRRYGLLEDVEKGIALIQHLENIPYCNAVTIPSDIPSQLTDIVCYQKIYKYSEKPGGTYVLSPASAKYIIQMSKVLGREAGYFLETVSPLQFRGESLEMALIYAKNGQPLSLGPMVMGGATGPVTAAGTILLANAEVLGSIFVIYALTGKLYGGHGAFSHSMDLRSMLCSFGSPNQALFGIACAQLAKYYGLESATNSGLTDAILPDFQAGYEKASSALLSYLSGGLQMGAQGIVGADQGFSFEQLVIDNEWMSACNYLLDGFQVNEETLAASLVEQVGIGGNFLAEEHTAVHMRDSYWFGKLFNRVDWDVWKEEKTGDIVERAHEIVETVTGDYKSADPVIEPSKAEEIDYLVKCAWDELEFCSK